MKITEECFVCDFCGKVNGFVEVMIVGKDGVHICNECVDVSVEICKDARSRKAQEKEQGAS